MFRFTCNLNDCFSPRENEIREAFHSFGTVVDVSCPKPLVVTQQTKDANSGFAFVRFSDVRDRTKAFQAIQAGRVRFDGQEIKGKELLPSFWPTEQSRRYY